MRIEMTADGYKARKAFTPRDLLYNINAESWDNTNLKVNNPQAKDLNFWLSFCFCYFFKIQRVSRSSTLTVKLFVHNNVLPKFECRWLHQEEKLLKVFQKVQGFYPRVSLAIRWWTPLYFSYILGNAVNMSTIRKQGEVSRWAPGKHRESPMKCTNHLQEIHPCELTEDRFEVLSEVYFCFLLSCFLLFAFVSCFHLEN